MRKNGVLMHMTSLPGDYGVGTMGKEAYDFVDFLARAGQSVWQLLPLTPTGYGDSPYQSHSTYAGNHYLIDPALLVEQGLLLPEELAQFQWGDDPGRVDFGLLYQTKHRLLRLAYDRFADDEALDRFCRENSHWLSEYALYMAISGQHGGLGWQSWPEQLKFRDPDALWQKRNELRHEIRYFCFVQYVFYTQWQALRSYAHQKGIRLMGDVPIYVPLDSVDVWTDPELFQLDAGLRPTDVAGVPPDLFSEDGQLWGNPLYRWDVMAKDGYSWWVRRLRAAGGLFDVVRVDHFRGLESYWSVPYGEKTAKNGRWVKGPGMGLVEAIRTQLPQLELIAEDLGVMTPEVEQLLADSGYPGMKVLQFAFDGCGPSEYQPHCYTPNYVCYTGTHDNMTTRQWFDTATPEAAAYARRYMGVGAHESDVWAMIRTAMASVAELCIIPVQDLLELGEEGRMNFPGTLGNWTWRMQKGALTPQLAQRLQSMTALYGRLATQTPTLGGKT